MSQALFPVCGVRAALGVHVATLETPIVRAGGSVGLGLKRHIALFCSPQYRSKHRGACLPQKGIFRFCLRRTTKGQRQTNAQRQNAITNGKGYPCKNDTR